jgi:hypothetical protein
MENPRKSGILLMLGSTLVFVGINYDQLSPSFFPVGLLLFPIGLLLFMKGNRTVIEQAEERAKRAVNPSIRSVTADAFAARQATGIFANGEVSGQLRDPSSRRLSGAELERGEEMPPRVLRDEISIPLDEPDDVSSGNGPTSASLISTDVSFPSEPDEAGTLSAEIAKLRRLWEDGIIDEQEFSAAKAKILS